MVNGYMKKNLSLRQILDMECYFKHLKVNGSCRFIAMRTEMGDIIEYLIYLKSIFLEID